LRDKLLFPLLPDVLAKIFENLSDENIRYLLNKVFESYSFFKNDEKIKRITQNKYLLPIVFPSGIRMVACENIDKIILSLPKWDKAPEIIRNNVIHFSDKHKKNIYLIDIDTLRLGGCETQWNIEYFVDILEIIPFESLKSIEGLEWVSNLLRHIFRNSQNVNIDIKSNAANWIANCIAKKSLIGITKTKKNENTADRFRSIWRDIFTLFPEEWIIETSFESYQAVVEAAQENLIGSHLIPVPLGCDAPTNIESLSEITTQKISALIQSIGKKNTDKKSSQNKRISRLMLAESLLAVTGIDILDEQMRQLPLIRAQKLPDEKDESLSISNLMDFGKQYRVFFRPVLGEGIDKDPEIFHPKKSVRMLADAVGESFWLVDQSVSKVVDLPSPEAHELAEAVLSSKAIRSTIKNRVTLVQVLQRYVINNSVVRLAMLSLLTGRILANEEECKLYCVLSKDLTGLENKRSVKTLLELIGRSWWYVDAQLVDSIPYNIFEHLGISDVDYEVLQKLLLQCFEMSVDWSEMSKDDIVQILTRMHSMVPAYYETWKKIPLHRYNDGKRGIIDKNTYFTDNDYSVPKNFENEIKILEPDQEISKYYVHVKKLDKNAILRIMLKNRTAYLYSNYILNGLIHERKNIVTLPSDQEIISLLIESPWLPLESEDSGVSPKKILYFHHNELLEAVNGLANNNAIGAYILANRIDPNFWIRVRPLIISLFEEFPLVQQITRLSTALKSIDTGQIDNGAYLLMCKPEEINDNFIENVFATPLIGNHKGWKFIHIVNKFAVKSSDANENFNNSIPYFIVELAQSFCSNIPAHHQISILNTIASSSPSKDSPSGMAFKSILSSFVQSSDFSTKVLANIKLPTQDGQWRLPNEIAKSATGVSKRHRLISELRDVLQVESNTIVQSSESNDNTIGHGVDNVLNNYFNPWKNRIPHGAVGSFIALLGDGLNDKILSIAQRWLGPDIDIEGLRSNLGNHDFLEKCENVRVSFHYKIFKGGHLQAENLLSEYVDMDVSSDNESIFATDPKKFGSAYGDYWEIRLRDVDPESKTPEELVKFLKNAVQWWTERVLQVERKIFNEWWKIWADSSQVQIRPVKSSILAHLPLTLQTLDVSEKTEIFTALQEAQKAQRRREQASPNNIHDANMAERKALDNLSDLITQQRNHHFIWSRVHAMMKRYGYSEDSVLVELAQNADDALTQSLAICGSPLPIDVSKLIVKVSNNDEVTTIDVIHYGRPINETGGSVFEAQSDRQWDQDLYFMMLLNLSAKPGEHPGKVDQSSTTGKFGLGFKSVHLISQRPSVVSRFLSFSIVGGLLPIEEPIPTESLPQPINSHYPTRIRLPLLPNDNINLNTIFRRFQHASVLLPVFSRGIRQVIVEGCSFSGVSSFDGKPIDHAPGWSIGLEELTSPGLDQVRVLRFRPSDFPSSVQIHGTEALAIGIKNNQVVPFPHNMPFLWNVTPTNETWGCGYAVNGPFKLDPGRTHISLDDSATRKVVNNLGEALGDGLITLHDALEKSDEEPIRDLPTGNHAAEFVTTLWKVLASGLDNADESRRQFLLGLHGDGRGISKWMQHRQVVPSGLPTPFNSQLPLIDQNILVHVATEGLDDPALCNALSKIRDMAELLKNFNVVCSEIEFKLKHFLHKSVQILPLTPHIVLKNLAENWRNRLNLNRFFSLRPLVDDSVWQYATGKSQGNHWHSNLEAKSLKGDYVSLRKLLLPVGKFDESADENAVEEKLRSSFAPATHILSPTYIEHAEDMKLFLLLRVRHEIDARMLVSWYVKCSEHQRSAALNYLIEGKLRNEVLNILDSSWDSYPDWLRNYDLVKELLNQMNVSEKVRNPLLIRLFPHLFSDQTATGQQVKLDNQTKKRFFNNFLAWWDKPLHQEVVLKDFEKKSWPNWLLNGDLAKALKNGSEDHWLGLLVLGACQRFGRTLPSHHRAFLQFVFDQKWWEIFKQPENDTDWMEILRDWQDNATCILNYNQWMSLFPTVYQLSRYNDVYCRLLRNSAKRDKKTFNITTLLTPRGDENLSGAGLNFDAPPAPLDIGLHWILRELYRLKVIRGDHLLPSCWVPSRKLIELLNKLGMEPLDDTASNPQKAETIFEFLRNELKTETPHLHQSFDIPLLYVAENEKLQQQLGLEA